MNDGVPPALRAKQSPRTPGESSRPWPASSVALILGVAALSACSADGSRPDPATLPRPVASGPAGRIVAVGDLHGDVDASLSVLRLAGLVDDQGHWAGGTTTLVQTGDTTDRGPSSRGVLELMIRLEQEAPAAGGRVLALLGNHEAMNLTGDWRYVSPQDLADFGGEEARREALSPSADLGRWLRARDTAVQLDDVVFVHGGLRPEWARLGAEGVSRAVRDALLGTGPPTVLGVEGPLWYRGYMMAPEPLACGELSQALTAMGARRMVVGHTTQRSGKIASRCNGQILAIDTGISAHYGGHIAALELADGDARALYPDGPVDLPDP